MQDIHVVTFSSKFGFVHIPRQKRLKMWCQWKERHSFVLQMPFWVDWSSLSSCYADGWNTLIRYSFQSLKWAFKSVNLCNWKRNRFFSPCRPFWPPYWCTKVVHQYDRPILSTVIKSKRCLPIGKVQADYRDSVWLVLVASSVQFSKNIVRWFSLLFCF